jgi:hypothetical protein
MSQQKHPPSHHYHQVPPAEATLVGTPALMPRSQPRPRPPTAWPRSRRASSAHGCRLPSRTRHGRTRRHCRRTRPRAGARPRQCRHLVHSAALRLAQRARPSTPWADRCRSLRTRRKRARDRRARGTPQRVRWRWSQGRRVASVAWLMASIDTLCRTVYIAAGILLQENPKAVTTKFWPRHAFMWHAICLCTSAS